MASFGPMMNGAPMQSARKLWVTDGPFMKMVLVSGSSASVVSHVEPMHFTTMLVLIVSLLFVVMLDSLNDAISDSITVSLPSESAMKKVSLTALPVQLK